MATKAKTTEIATTGSDDNLPDYLKGYDGPTVDSGLGNEDIVLPQIKLLQGVSGEISEYDDAKPGHFWHTGADMDMGADLKFIPIKLQKKYLLIAPMDDGQGVLARADDGVTWDRTGSWEVKLDKRTTVTWEITDESVIGSGLAKWGTSEPSDEDSPPAATLIYEYLVLLPDHIELGPVIMSFSRSAIKKVTKGLNSKIKLAEGSGKPMQSLVFKAAAGLESNGTNEYHAPNFVRSGFATKDQFEMAVEFAQNLTDYRGEAEEEHAGEGGSSVPDRTDI